MPRANAQPSQQRKSRNVAWVLSDWAPDALAAAGRSWLENSRLSAQPHYVTVSRYCPVSSESVCVTVCSLEVALPIPNALAHDAVTPLPGSPHAMMCRAPHL